jgi:SPP1 family predicted phage head-tail adaptor
MNKRITIQVFTEVEQPGGGLSEEWTDELTTWAQVEPLSAKRMVVAEKVVISEGYSIILRWANGRILDKTRRVIYNDQTLTINGAVIKDEAKRFWQLTCIINA